MSPLARALGAFTLLASVSGWAAHPLVTDDTGTQGAAGWQLEVTADHLFNRDADGHLSERTNALTLTRGLTDSTDLGVSMPWLSRRDPMTNEGRHETGLGDVGLTIKHRYLERDSLQMGLKVSISLPNGELDKGLGKATGTQSLYHLTSMSTEAGTALFNVGLIHNGDSRAIVGEHPWLWAASAAWLMSPIEGWTLAFDLGAQRQSARTESKNPAYGLIALIWSISPKIDLDVGYKRALNSAESDKTLSVGLTQRW